MDRYVVHGVPRGRRTDDTSARQPHCPKHRRRSRAVPWLVIAAGAVRASACQLRRLTLAKQPDALEEVVIAPSLASVVTGQWRFGVVSHDRRTKEVDTAPRDSGCCDSPSLSDLGDMGVDTRGQARFEIANIVVHQRDRLAPAVCANCAAHCREPTHKLIRHQQL